MSDASGHLGTRRAVYFVFIQFPEDFFWVGICRGFFSPFLHWSDASVSFLCTFHLAACHKFVKLNTERATTGPATPDSHVSSEAGLSPRVTKKGAPAPSASKSHGSTRFFDNRSHSVKVTSSGSGGAQVQKKTTDQTDQLHLEWTDAVNSCQHQRSSQGGISDQLDGVTYPGSLQDGWDITHPKGACAASAATAAATAARKNVAAASRAPFAPASRIISKLRRIEKHSLDVLHARDVSSHQRGNALEVDAFSSPPRRMVRFH